MRGHNDKLTHCIVSCRIARECAPGLFGWFAAWVAGDVVQDPFWRRKGAQAEEGVFDRRANKVGRSFRTRKESCQSLCIQAQQAGRFELPANPNPMPDGWPPGI
jgi:hypothetical protein